MSPFVATQNICQSVGYVRRRMEENGDVICLTKGRAGEGFVAVL